MHIVLVEPEIPQNTGNIARTCALTKTTLHLVEPLGFSIDDRALKRAGLDYWHLVDVKVHQSLDEILKAYPENRFWFATTKVDQKYSDIRYQYDDFLVFGKETKGLGKELIEAHRDHCITIPMIDIGRSLNLSNSANIILYEAMRQLSFPGLGKE